MIRVRFLPAVAIVIMALNLCATRAHAQPHGTRITGIYSDMAMHDGDVIGDEAFILFTSHGYYVVFQHGEGEPGVPMTVPADLHGNAISFTLPVAADPRGAFHGHIVDGILEGHFDGNGQTLRLKRKPSYWQ
ncbi:hypothetical protein AB7849_10600 [Rhodanobacter sp. 115]|uniref:hypothetical protein n=1 Tax=Rhodanobacter sp. FW021-MT20 TaxID=1162282 RepID=UPI00055DFE3E|nr:hypothetical protein [Rhodanobacter sp. 115]